MMDNKINGRTPEDIKKGLEHCTSSPLCHECPYFAETDCNALEQDALALIQQLERERDAAVELLYDLAVGERTFCDACAYKGNVECHSEQKVMNADCWEWECVQEVE